jgi:hypothetical protein
MSFFIKRLLSYLLPDSLLAAGFQAHLLSLLFTLSSSLFVSLAPSGLK